MRTKSDTADGKKQLKANERKWTRKVWSAGWTAMPNALIYYQKALGLSAIDVGIILNLVSYWWLPENHPYPSKKRIGDAMGVDAKTVQRRIAAMEQRGYIKRQARKSAERGHETNRYELAGLVAALEKHAQELLAKRAERERTKTAPRRRGSKS